MKKKIIIIGIASLFLCGCGKIPTLSNGEEAVITFEDGMISVNDLYKEIKDAHGLSTLINMIDKHIYEKEVKDKMSDAKTYAESYVKQLIQSAGDEEKALQMIQSYYNYQTFDAFKNYLYLNYLQSEAIEAYVKGKITEDELKEYYEKSVYPDMTISHILITPKVTNDMKAEDKTKAEQEAKDKIKKVIDELNTAKENNEDVAKKFAELAAANSEDSSNKDKGGDLGSINIGSLNSDYDELVKAAANLKDGEYSTELITTEIGYHVILKTKTGDKKKYDDAVNDMKDTITNNKLSGEDGNKLMIEAIKHYREKYKVDVIDSELDSQYGKYMNNLINSANTKN
ncbi:MAG: peptidylprolyl isomerase [Bacilli bacterium]|nr:peptidylprolyl isomerase [Bacilli bacterium]